MVLVPSAIELNDHREPRRHFLQVIPVSLEHSVLLRPKVDGISIESTKSHGDTIRRWTFSLWYTNCHDASTISYQVERRTRATEMCLASDVRLVGATPCARVESRWDQHWKSSEPRRDLLQVAPVFLVNHVPLNSKSDDTSTVGTNSHGCKHIISYGYSLFPVLVSSALESKYSRKPRRSLL
jgi:hypothetical protein